mmetsp:Transcript_26884/g.71601  ORF Transcript_26884/g.71601 Transcript_26884/m.71601 type:complete len:327 (+) Transcript_26884:401-1381(+)
MLRGGPRAQAYPHAVHGRVRDRPRLPGDGTRRAAPTQSTDRAPRYQERQLLVCDRRHREALRLRLRRPAALERAAPLRVLWHGALHVAGDGAQRGSLPEHRHVVARGDGVRPAVRGLPVPAGRSEYLRDEGGHQHRLPPSAVPAEELRGGGPVGGRRGLRRQPPGAQGERPAVRGGGPVAPLPAAEAGHAGRHDQGAFPGASDPPRPHDDAAVRGPGGQVHRGPQPGRAAAAAAAAGLLARPAGLPVILRLELGRRGAGGIRRRGRQPARPRPAAPAVVPQEILRVRGLALDGVHSPLRPEPPELRHPQPRRAVLRRVSARKRSRR